jgi:Flp pilus assembly protein TadG
MLRDRSGSEMAETAVTMPVVLLVLMLVINGSLAGYTASCAAGAADAGARAGAAATVKPEAWAGAEVVLSMNRWNMGGEYSYSVQADKEPGGAVKVMVAWRYPSMLSGLCRFFGGNCPEYFSGVATATRKREGW